jgi:hypothetical protein
MGKCMYIVGYTTTFRSSVLLADDHDGGIGVNVWIYLLVIGTRN